MVSTDDYHSSLIGRIFTLQYFDVLCEKNSVNSPYGFVCCFRMCNVKNCVIVFVVYMVKNVTTTGILLNFAVKMQSERKQLCWKNILFTNKMNVPDLVTKS